MRNLVVLVLITFTGVGLAADNAADQEKLSLVIPAWDVTVLKTSLYHPSSAILIGSHLYFADWIGKDDCRSQNVFRVDLKKTEREPELLAEVPCVERLEKVGESLLILRREPQGEGKLLVAYFLESGKLVAATPSADHLKLHQARVALADDYSPSERRSAVDSTLLSGEVLALLEERTAEGKPQLNSDLLSALAPRRIADSIHYLPEVSLPDLLQVQVSSGNKMAYYVSAGPTYARILAIPLQSGGRVGRSLGVNAELNAWERADQNTWSIRNPSYFSATDYGFLAYEDSGASAVLRALSYYSYQDNLFYRVRLPEESFIRGVQYTRNGILVSRPGIGEVHWFGAVQDAFATESKTLEFEVRRNVEVPFVEESKENK